MKKFLISLLSLCLPLLADQQFQALDLGTLLFASAEARALNAKDTIAGKIHRKSSTDDFMWKPDTGLKVIQYNTDPTIYPALSDNNQMIGYELQYWSLLDPEIIRSYHLEKDGTIYRGVYYLDRGLGCSIFLNDSIEVLCHSTDVYEVCSKLLKRYEKWTFLSAGDYHWGLYAAPTALNNNNQVLYSYITNGVLGSNMFAYNELYIYDIDEDEIHILASDKAYYGTGLNDQGVAIAHNKLKTEGFYGTESTGMISLSNFIPKAINNNGAIVGLQSNRVILREPDGTMVDVFENTEFNLSNTVEFVDVWEINDKGNILVEAKIGGALHPLLLLNVS